MTQTFKKELLKEVTAQVEARFPLASTHKDDAWVQRTSRHFYVFHGPSGFERSITAVNQTQALYLGWVAFLQHRGV